MCEATTLLAIASIASATTGVIAQEQAASAQEASNQRQYENTVRAYSANVNQTNLMAEQERAGAMQKLEENNMNARAAQSTATVAAGESGISGLSVDALLGDLSGKQNRYNTSVMTNLDSANSAIQNKRDNVYADAASTINGLKTPAMPDYAGAALKIAGAYNNYQNPTAVR